jgi:hypothetical protein
VEWRVAELAARGRRETPERAPKVEHGAMLAGQDGAPLLLGGLVLRTESIDAV